MTGQYDLADALRDLDTNGEDGLQLTDFLVYDNNSDGIVDGNDLRNFTGAANIQETIDEFVYDRATYLVGETDAENIAELQSNAKTLATFTENEDALKALNYIQDYQDTTPSTKDMSTGDMDAAGRVTLGVGGIIIGAAALTGAGYAYVNYKARKQVQQQKAIEAEHRKKKKEEKERRQLIETQAAQAARPKRESRREAALGLFRWKKTCDKEYYEKHGFYPDHRRRLNDASASPARRHRSSIRVLDALIGERQRMP